MIVFLRFLVLILTFSCAPSIQAASDALQKPKDMAALVWLSKLEQKRNTAELQQDSAQFNQLSQEISATLAGKYGLRKDRTATPTERKQMIASITRTRNHFAGMPNILSQLYFKHNPDECWARINNVKDSIYKQHMGIVLAVDAIYDKARDQEDFSETLATERKAPIMSPEFIKQIIDIATDLQQEPLRKTIEDFSPDAWKKLAEETGQQLDIAAPNISAQQIFLELMAPDVANTGYKGWEIHGLNALGSWTNEGGSLISTGKKIILKDRPELFVSRPLWHQGLRLDSNFKGHFQKLDSKYFNGEYVGVSYSLFCPLHDGTNFSCPPIRFYLTNLSSI